MSLDHGHSATHNVLSSKSLHSHANVTELKSSADTCGSPDIDTIYTMRLKALMLFEDYKKTRNKDLYRDANKFFTKAMDHAQQQPESKRVITERVKVSKALFHLDIREECRQQEKEHDTLEELECRAQDTLDDVEEEYLTNGDRAFFYLTRAKLLVCVVRTGLEPRQRPK